MTEHIPMQLATRRLLAKHEELRRKREGTWDPTTMVSQTSPEGAALRAHWASPDKVTDAQPIAIELLKNEAPPKFKAACEFTTEKPQGDGEDHAGLVGSPGEPVSIRRRSPEGIEAPRTRQSAENRDELDRLSQPAEGATPGAGRDRPGSSTAPPGNNAKKKKAGAALDPTHHQRGCHPARRSNPAAPRQGINTRAPAGKSGETARHRPPHRRSTTPGAGRDRPGSSTAPPGKTLKENCRRRPRSNTPSARVPSRAPCKSGSPSPRDKDRERQPENRERELDIELYHCQCCGICDRCR